jgi:BRCT domain type II-containing protein
MIEAFGGIVTGSVSGKTNFLVVGKEPGASKVALSREKGIPMLDIKSLKDKIMGDLPELEHAKAPAIQSFSAGYKNNRVMD